MRLVEGACGTIQPIAISDRRLSISLSPPLTRPSSQRYLANGTYFGSATKRNKNGSVANTRISSELSAKVFDDEQDGPCAEGHAAVGSVVSDTSCGNPPEKPESIFRQFEWVDSSTHQTRNETRVRCVSRNSPFSHTDCVVGLGLGVVPRSNMCAVTGGSAVYLTSVAVRVEMAV